VSRPEPVLPRSCRSRHLVIAELDKIAVRAAGLDTGSSPPPARRPAASIPVARAAQAPQSLLAKPPPRRTSPPRPLTRRSRCWPGARRVAPGRHGHSPAVVAAGQAAAASIPAFGAAQAPRSPAGQAPAASHQPATATHHPQRLLARRPPRRCWWSKPFTLISAHNRRTCALVSAIATVEAHDARIVGAGQCHDGDERTQTAIVCAGHLCPSRFRQPAAELNTDQPTTADGVAHRTHRTPPLASTNRRQQAALTPRPHASPPCRSPRPP
jgi:hypothetical protein